MFRLRGAASTAGFAMTVSLLALSHAHTAQAKQPSRFTACEAQDGFTPIQVLMFAGEQPDPPDYISAIQPNDDGGGGLIALDHDKPTPVYWDLRKQPKPWNMVCGFVDSKSKAAKDEIYLNTDDANAIKKRITVPIPDDATKCTITDVPGPNKDFPIMGNIVCDLKPGANQASKPNHS